MNWLKNRYKTGILLVVIVSSHALHMQGMDWTGWITQKIQRATTTQKVLGAAAALLATYAVVSVVRNPGLVQDAMNRLWFGPQPQQAPGVPMAPVLPSAPPAPVADSAPQPLPLPSAPPASAIRVSSLYTQQTEAIAKRTVEALLDMMFGALCQNAISYGKNNQLDRHYVEEIKRLLAIMQTRDTSNLTRIVNAFINIEKQDKNPSITLANALFLMPSEFIRIPKNIQSLEPYINILLDSWLALDNTAIYNTTALSNPLNSSILFTQIHSYLTNPDIPWTKLFLRATMFHLARRIIQLQKVPGLSKENQKQLQVLKNTLDQFLLQKTVLAQKALIELQQEIDKIEKTQSPRPISAPTTGPALYPAFPPSAPALPAERKSEVAETKSQVAQSMRPASSISSPRAPEPPMTTLQPGFRVKVKNIPARSREVFLGNIPGIGPITLEYFNVTGSSPYWYRAASDDTEERWESDFDIDNSFSMDGEFIFLGYHDQDAP